MRSTRRCARVLPEKACNFHSTDGADRFWVTDLKPANIMLVPDPETPSGERVKILDFGIAKILETDGDEQRLTNTDSLLGTPTYMSPEQCRSAREVTDRSDVYSLGVIAYEVLTGTQPFRGRSEIETIMRHRSLVPPSCRELQPAIPAEFAQLVSNMLSKTPQERPSAAELKQAINRILRTTSVSSLPSSASLPPLPAGRSGEAEAPTRVASSDHLPTLATDAPATLVTARKPSSAPEVSASPESFRIQSSRTNLIVILVAAAIVVAVIAVIIAG